MNIVSVLLRLWPGIPLFRGMRAGTPARRDGLLWALPLLAVLPAAPLHAETLKLSTWNLDWLSLRPAGDPFLPADRLARSAEDYRRLRRYAAVLNADVIALQEVEDVAAAAQVFPPDRYDIVLAGGSVAQHAGFAIRHGLPWTAAPDLAGLELAGTTSRPLRRGAAIVLQTGNGPLALLSLHLKSGCWAAPLGSTARACALLRAQLPPLSAWIGAQLQAGTPFVILGDLNRRMDQRPGDPPDPLLVAIQGGAGLVRATSGHASPCWGGEGFIDHILAGEQAAEWLQPQSLRVLVYREADPAMKDHLSDHCPVSVTLKLPEPPEVK